MSALPPLVPKLEHVDGLETQRSTRAPRHTLTTGKTGGIRNRESLPRVAPHVDPERAVERANPAFDATRRLGNHMRRDHGAASLRILVEQAVEHARRQPRGPFSILSS